MHHSETFGNVAERFGDQWDICVILTHHFRPEISFGILENVSSVNTSRKLNLAYNKHMRSR